MSEEPIAALLARQRSTHTLEQPFYNDARIFELDLRQVLAPQWQYVDHVSSLPNVGDYLLYEFADESIIVVRDKDETIKAHFNVCRHRGSQICLEPRGNVKRLVCPYHAWAYRLDGSLDHARHMPQEFDRDAHGLAPCRVQVFEGLIFVNLGDEEVADFDDIASHVGPFAQLHHLADAKVVHRETYPTYANWKLAVENFRECYHCAPAHPQYTTVNKYVRMAERELHSYDDEVQAWAKTQSDSSRPVGFHRWPENRLQPHSAWRQPIGDGFLTLTEDGTAAAPLMGEFAEYDGAETGIFMGCLSYFYATNDHATTFRFSPVNTHFTMVELAWLVRADAQEGKDYDLDHLKWMWDVTTIQDTKIINDNQKGVNSSRYVPGPYSLQEIGSTRFAEWYLSRLSAADL